MKFLDRFFSAPTEAKFAKRLTDAMRQAGDDRQIVYDPAQFQLILKKSGKDGWINLRNLFVEYCLLARAERPAWLNRIRRGLLPQLEMPDDFEDVKPDLRPSVRSRSLPDLMSIEAEAREAKHSEIPSMPISEYLIACLAYDLPQSMGFVNQNNLDTWGVSLYEAMEVARQNLNEQPPICASLSDKLYIFQSGDAYDGTRMLMLDMIRRLKVEGLPLALPITRDCLMVTGSGDLEGQRMMVELAVKTEVTRPLCSIPHVLDRDEWMPWSPSADHPQFESFRMLELRHFGSEYAEQKELLDRLNEKMGVDVFVATYNAISFAGKDQSYAQWTKSVSSWLPKVELIAFFDPEVKAVKGFVSWDVAIQEFGPMMEQLDHWPPRWFVEHFPTDEQLRKAGSRMPQQ